MKKVLSFVGCALFVAAMAISCKSNQEATDTLVEDTTVMDAVEEVATADQMSEADHQAMLDAAAEAGRAKCNCYKTDAASVESCIKSILSESYAAYEGNEEFQAAMEEEYNNCIKEKATAAAKEAGDKAVKEGAKAIANQLKK
jgi:phosphoglycolate phosphatase-like HAD superfamily hydrolase